MNYSKSIAQVFSILFLIVVSSCNIEPFEGDIPEQGTEPVQPASCVEAVQNTATAATNFATVLSTDTDYAVLCAIYKKALEDQIAVCGDEGGAFQSLIDSLGDCNEDDTTNNSEDDGDYWPMAIGNSWTHTFQVSGMPSTESTMEISDLVDYQGAPSYLYENFFGSVQSTDGTGFENLQVDYYTRKLNGDYMIFVDELTADLSGLYRVTQTAYDYVILKDNVDVGTEWNYNFDVVTSYEPLAGGLAIPDIATNYDIRLEILEKEASVVVGETTYDSVIVVKFYQKVSVVGLPAGTSTVEYIYSFAKDIGLVKVEGTVFDSDDNITSNVLQEITSYVIN